MIPIASPLNIIDFAVLEFQFKFVPPKAKPELDLKQYFDKYELDIDFTINTSDKIQVFIKAEINRGKKILPGYSILAEIACVFDFNNEIEITKEAKHSIEGFSTIYIALNSLRGFINQITATGPLGKYIFPSIDLNDLVKKKKLSIIETEKTDNKVKKNKAASKK